MTDRATCRHYRCFGADDRNPLRGSPYGGEDRNGYTFCWEYDKEGRCVHTRGADGDQEGWISYFPEQGYNTVRDACGAESTYRYDANQLVRSIADALGNTTRYDCTEEMEPYREIDPEGRITGWHYDGREQTGG